jgi:hypothetical protein
MTELESRKFPNRTTVTRDRGSRRSGADLTTTLAADRSHWQPHTGTF